MVCQILSRSKKLTKLMQFRSFSNDSNNDDDKYLLKTCFCQSTNDGFMLVIMQSSNPLLRSCQTTLHLGRKIVLQIKCFQWKTTLFTELTVTFKMIPKLLKIFWLSQIIICTSCMSDGGNDVRNSNLKTLKAKIVPELICLHSSYP